MLDLASTEYIVKIMRRSLSVSDVAIKLGTSVETIIEIIASKGFKSLLTPQYRLTDEDVDRLCNAYVRSVKKFYQKRKKERQEVDYGSLSLAKYLKSIFGFGIDEEAGGFDEDKARREFYFLIYSSVTTEISSSVRQLVKKIFRRLQIRLCSIYSDNRRRLFSLVVSNHYHIFPSEEDHSIRVPEKMTLGHSIALIKNVAILSNAYLRTKWKNIQNSFNTFRIAIYPQKINQRSLIYCQLIQLT